VGRRSGGPALLQIIIPLRCHPGAESVRYLDPREAV
jgi:hypothetical protein